MFRPSIGGRAVARSNCRRSGHAHTGRGWLHNGSVERRIEMIRDKLRIAVFVILAFGAGMASAAEQLMVYTSMKESLMGKLRDEFVKRNPGIQFDYYSAGAGKLMAKIAAERQAGKLTVDVLWHSEVPDFIDLK